MFISFAKKILVTTCVVFYAYYGASSDDKVSLVFLTEDNPPYNSLDKKTGALTGIAVDAVKEMMKRLDADYTIGIVPFNRGMLQVQSENNTCLFVMNRTEDRENKFAWVGPLYTGGWAFFKRAGSPIKIESMAPEALNKYQIFGGTATAPTIYVRKKGIKVTGVKTAKDSLRLLYLNRGDLVLGGVTVLKMLATEQNYPKPEIAHYIFETVLSMGCSKQMPKELIQRMNMINLQMTDFKNNLVDNYKPN